MGRFNLVLTHCFLISAVLVSSLLSSGCRTPGLGVTVYQHQVHRAGMYRSQKRETVPYVNANGWYCMNPVHFRVVVDFVQACRSTPNTNEGQDISIFEADSLNVKVYQHQVARGGMYRGQDREFVPYQDADKWYCMTPVNFQKVVDFVESCRNTPNTNQEKK